MLHGSSVNCIRFARKCSFGVFPLENAVEQHVCRRKAYVVASNIMKNNRGSTVMWKVYQNVRSCKYPGLRSCNSAEKMASSKNMTLSTLRVAGIYRRCIRLKMMDAFAENARPNGLERDGYVPQYSRRPGVEYAVSSARSNASSPRCR